MSLENIRRTADRGINRAQGEKDSSYADIFQHILDEVERCSLNHQSVRNDALEEAAQMAEAYDEYCTSQYIRELKTYEDTI